MNFTQSNCKKFTGVREKERNRRVCVYVCGAQITRNGFERGGFSVYAHRICPLSMYACCLLGRIYTCIKKRSLNMMWLFHVHVSTSSKRVATSHCHRAAAAAVVTIMCVFASMAFLNLFVHIHVFRKSACVSFNEFSITGTL